jgi:uncharacterized protein (DUF58 family)
MRRVIFISLLLFCTVLVALATMNGVLLALSIPMILYLGTSLLFGPEELNIVTNREIETDQAVPNAPIKILLTIKNNGSRLERIFIKEQIPPGLEVIDGDTSLLTVLATGETTKLVYTVRGGRGYYRFHQVEVLASDTFGLYHRQGKIPAAGRLLVQPEVLRVGRLPIRPRGTRVYSGYIPARQGGPGVEFFGVREYQAGDPLRWINWRSSARHRQSIFINEFQQERVADVGIILDTRRRSEVKLRNGASLFEYGVLAAAALADTFLSDGNRVGLLLYGTQLDWTFPGYGKIQREQILQSLARAEPGDSLIFGSLDHLPTRLFPPNAQLVIISPLQNDDHETLIRLRARGYALLVISPDPITFEAAGIKDRDETTQLAIRLSRLERVLMIKKLRQAGIQVLDWRTEDPLDKAIRFSMSRVVPQIHYSGINL